MPKSFPSRSLSRLVIYLSFAATGVGMALPGAVLPALMAQWGLVDRQGGLLFFLGWLGSSLGALAVRPQRTRSLTAGRFLTALGAMGMAFGSGWSCYPCMAVFGLGLGLTMTSISLLQAARHAERRRAELNRLNLVWALGACVCPSLAVHSLRVVSARAIFSVLGFFFLLVCLWGIFFEYDVAATISIAQSATQRWSFSLWPISLVLIIMLPTGIESSMGGWVTAYVERAQHTISATVTAGTCFWMGLTLSRTLASALLMAPRSERLVLCVSLCVVLAGMCLTVAGIGPGLLAGIFLVGFGLGPVYPLLLSIALRYSENTTIFFMAGVGSAFFPWLTGVVSSTASSLRIGLLVPLAASALMLVLGLQVVAITRKDYRS